MKKTNQIKKVTFLIMFSFLFSLNFSFAQTLEERQQIIANYDLEKLDQMAIDAAEKYTANKQRALELAAIYGWELIIELPNGGKSELIGVSENGNPLYVSTTNREGAITTRTDKVHTGGGAGLDLNGENMIIGIWDSGRVRETHELFNSPITQLDGATEISDHATHVAGTLVGTGTVQDGAAKGMAPEAELWASDWNNDGAEWIDAAANGLLISNHSYLYTESDYALWEFGYYSWISEYVDNVTYNAPYCLPIYAAGNSRNDGYNTEDGGYDYLLNLTTSKNALAVAAVNEVLDYSGASSVVMSEFSSWGPTDDGRIKPDISAKGVAMFSSVGDADDSYANYNGTSMSAPNTTGSLILLQQHYNNLNENYMLASTLRGLAIHTADEAGTDPGPDYRFGWGLLNIEKAAEVISNNGISSLIVEEEIQYGEVYTFSVQSNGIDDLNVSIAWTDAPGVPLPPGPEIEDKPTPMLINDLDLRVSQDGGATYYPWKLDPANFSAPATTGDNLVDNVEKVDIVGAMGEYIIEVSHKGTLTNDSQVFSLIITGLEEILSTEDFDIKGLVAHPNPTTNILNVEAASVISSVEVMNVLGQTLYTEIINTNKTQIDLSTFPTGNYFVRVTVENTTKVLQIIKQ